MRLVLLWAIVVAGFASAAFAFSSQSHEAPREASAFSVDGSRVTDGLLAVVDPVQRAVYTIARNGDRHLLLRNVLAFSWSPDGSHLAYITDVEPIRLYVAKVDGRDRRLLRTDNKMDSLAWAPNGRELAFGTSVRGYFDEHIFLVRRDGTELHELAAGGAPSWSPDGKKIAFARGAKVYVMRSDGKDQRPLARGSDPQWSPDGSRIAFQGNDYPQAIYTIAPEGKGKKKLTPGLAPAWSPDGSHLAFLCCAANPENGDLATVFSVNVRTGQRIRLSSRVDGDSMSWQPRPARRSS